MADQDQKGKWLSSKGAMKLSGCELMHRRERGELHMTQKYNHFSIL